MSTSPPAIISKKRGKRLRPCVEAVRIDAVAVGVGEEACAQVGAPVLEADLEQDAPECPSKLVVADSHANFSFVHRHIDSFL
jgi:hypothetical protein